MTADAAEEGGGGARSKTTRAVIDRIEDGGLAVVLVGEGESVDIPVSLLPEGAGAGDHLRISVALDEEARASRARSIRERLKRLGGGDTGRKDFKL